MQTDQSPSREAVMSLDVFLAGYQHLPDSDILNFEDGDDLLTMGHLRGILALLTPATTQPATGEAKVEQRHREAAADLAQWLIDAQKEWDGMSVWFASDAPRAFRDGAFDSHDFVQAFARFERDHLTPATQAGMGLPTQAVEAAIHKRFPRADIQTVMALADEIKRINR